MTTTSNYQEKLQNRLEKVLEELDEIWGELDPILYATALIDEQETTKEVLFGCCNKKLTVHPLTIYARCPKCSVKTKLRRYGSFPYDTLDLLDAAKEWLEKAEALNTLQ